MYRCIRSTHTEMHIVLRNFIRYLLPTYIFDIKFRLFHMTDKKKNIYLFAALPTSPFNLQDIKCRSREFLVLSLSLIEQIFGRKKLVTKKKTPVKMLLHEHHIHTCATACHALLVVCPSSDGRKYKKITLKRK